MTKQEYIFVCAEIEREKNASPFYLACRELPDNYEELKREYKRNEGIYIEPLQSGNWSFEKVNNLSLMPNINTNIYPKYIKP